MRTLKEKYSKYDRTIYRVVGVAPKQGRVARCDLCGTEHRERVEEGAEYVCHLCLMGMADSVDKKNKEGSMNFLEVLDAIKEGKILQFRKTYGFTQSLLAKRLGISTRHLRRMEDNAYIPVSKVIEKIRQRLENVRSV